MAEQARFTTISQRRTGELTPTTPPSSSNPPILSLSFEESYEGSPKKTPMRPPLTPTPTDNTPMDDQFMEITIEPIEITKGFTGSDVDTLPYWIAISFLFGSVLYTSGSFFWIIDDYLTDNDYFALVTVAFLIGGTAFLVGGYINFYGVINSPDPDEGLKGHPRRRRFFFHSGFCTYI